MKRTTSDEPPTGWNFGTWKAPTFISMTPTPDEQLAFEQQREAALLCDPATSLPVLRLGRAVVKDGQGMWHILRVK